jgi:hypothetical protein
MMMMMILNNAHAVHYGTVLRTLALSEGPWFECSLKTSYLGWDFFIIIIIIFFDYLNTYIVSCGHGHFLPQLSKFIVSLMSFSVLKILGIS